MVSLFMAAHAYCYAAMVRLQFFRPLQYISERNKILSDPIPIIMHGR